VGQYLPGHVRVSFDVVVRNRLSGVHLITPTFPAPPEGTRGILLFPFETKVLESSPRTSGGGGIMVVELPNVGRVAPSTDWDGAPHNFFNDVGCPMGARDCYRYETFGDPLPAGATSAASRVGFDVESTVSQFRFRAILAADLANAG